MEDIKLFKVFMSPDVTDKLNPILTSGYITQGNQVEEFERQLRHLFKYPYIVTTNSATSAQTLALRIIKDELGSGDVLSCPLTCMATNEPIVANGMDIKWVDVDPETALIDLDDLERKVDSNTKAMTFVHWGGYPLDMDKLHNILNRKELELGYRPYVVEDCAHAFLSEYKGRTIGTMGNFSVFSLQAIKHLTTGDGGLLFCPDQRTYDKAKLLRWYGIDRDKRNYKGKDFRLEEDVKEWGYKFHMNDINATIGLANLPHIPQLIATNRLNAFSLYEGLKDCVKILSPPDEDYNSAYWLFTICVPNKIEMIEYLKERGIMASQVHQRNDVNTCFKKYRTELPQMDELEKKLVCLPVGWWLTVNDTNRIVNCIREFILLHQEQ